MLAISPSDVRERRPGERLRVAGRVTVVRGPECQLADAIGPLGLTFRADPALLVGDLAVVEGELVDGGLVDVELVTCTRAPEPRGDGDFARLAWQGVAKNLVARARAITAVRRYFASEGFLEVETPFRVPAPGVDLHLDALRAHDGYLITSPELQMKRLLVAGLPRIFQIARVSRHEELGALHEPEFTMLEWYRAFSGLEQVLADTERLVREVALSVSGTPALFGADGRRFELEPPFPRVTVREAFREYAGVADAVDLAHSDEGRYFELWVEQVEPALAREPTPLFVWKYPANQAALARLCPSDSSVAERFELYVGGVELCNGFDELTEPREQRERFQRERAVRQAENRPVYPIDERFLRALESGLPPSGGNAVGLDRLVMLALGAREVAEVLAFPARFV